ncbi:hypothetical protein K7W42_21785 [Deinococcus sp. HMF7604]|uniref:hypothetical protein n=1 Tax=Deinococcus betulae TaxID=2873312 RepID=UPI001CC8F66C|nr:hypothetical protein [Deinococcus betulae]MBZ9753469.1 hypothetical protein [Deinococcus betulae]
MSTPLLGPVLLALWQHGPLPEHELLVLLPDATSAQVTPALTTLIEEGLIESCPDRHGTLYGPAVLCDETIAQQAYARYTGSPRCSGCGCTDTWPCPDGCWWVTPDRCSSCAGRGLVA